MDWNVDNASQDWPMQTDAPYDSDEDDENEIRQLDAVLEEADIEICDQGMLKSPRWGYSGSASQYAASPRPSNSLLVDLAIPSSSTATSVIEAPRVCNSGSTSQTASTSVPSHSTPHLQELSKLDSLLALNKVYDDKLRSLEQILGTRLKECRAKLDEIQNSPTCEKVENFRYINCGRPYFRDHQNAAAPDNEDAIMAKAQMYDFSLLTSVPGWTVRDKNHFTDVMTKVSLEVRKQNINDKIHELKHSVPSNKRKELEKEINKLRKQRDSLNAKMPFVDLALPLHQEYEWVSLADRLNKRHTAHEYRCLWKLYFHPSINKSSWKNTEHNQLQTLASEHHNQDWDEIARKLGTGRTGYQCFVYYRTNMNNSCVGKKWTHEEVTYLRRLIDYFREDVYIPWGKIAAAMENRTKVQIYNKYLRLIEQRKGRFLPEEDAVILNCVQRFGPNFRRMTEYLAHRSMVQIRSRYQVLANMRISTVWSVDDDKKLIQIMSNQDSNLTFAAATKFFPGKTRINIRSRYLTLIKWMKRHPDSKIEYAPRRGARRLNHGQATDDLNKAIEDLKNILNTEVTVKKDRKKITRDSDEVDIEDAIIATLVNEKVKEQEQKKSAYDGVLVLPNETVVSSKDLNLTNLRKFLVFLSSTLNRGLYKSSSYKDDYPELGEAGTDVSLIKVKSYSKKNTIKTIVMENSPDIWGKNVLLARNYVLPPHYATITGCKSLMSHVSAYSIYYNSINLHVLMRRNSVLKELVEQLLERFYALFLWPMMLSNEGPADFFSSKLCRDAFYVKPQPLALLPQAPGVTIKFRSLKKFKNNNVSEVIDLPEEDPEKKKEVTITEEFMNDDDVDDNIKKIMS